MKLLVHVKQEDIENGWLGDPTACMIQRAISRELGERVEGRELAVGYGDVEVDGVKVARISGAAVRKMWRADCGRDVEPFGIVVDWPDSEGTGI